ncbi:MAG: HIT family protein [Gammaproteobacteria bacterium]|nr:HIT family protein [Gammaproteobacteria bacterium]
MTIPLFWLYGLEYFDLQSDQIIATGISKKLNAVCPFCTLTAERISDADENAVVIRDGYPVSPGHTLIIPRRHVGSYFAATESERKSIHTLLDRAKADLDSEFKPDGYNIGINDGEAAGQTVPHMHLHLIPRYSGDVGDPRGGVRWVIVERARYWE